MSVAAVAGVAACAMMLALAQCVAIGITMVVTGVNHKDEPCEAPLADFAIVHGALALATVPFSCMMVLAAIGVAAKQNAATVGATLVTTLGLCGLGLARLGVLIWGTVLAFSDDRLQKYKDNTLVCSPDLYKTVYIVIIIEWVLTGFSACNNRKGTRKQDS